MMMTPLLLLICAGTPADSAASDTVRLPVPVFIGPRIPPDTVQQRPRAIEVSEWYGRRLTIHRLLSYATLPVFAMQYYAGNRLYEEGSLAPSWVKPAHQIGAGTLAGIFTVNTVTGAWNLWDSRKVPEGRALRTAHALLMLAANAGFTYAGVALGPDAAEDPEKRRRHRAIAITGIGVTVGSGLMMKIFNK